MSQHDSIPTDYAKAGAWLGALSINMMLWVGIVAVAVKAYHLLGGAAH